MKPPKDILRHKGQALYQKALSYLRHEQDKPQEAPKEEGDLKYFYKTVVQEFEIKRLTRENEKLTRHLESLQTGNDDLLAKNGEITSQLAESERKTQSYYDKLVNKIKEVNSKQEKVLAAAKKTQEWKGLEQRVRVAERLAEEKIKAFDNVYAELVKCRKKNL